MWKHEQTVSSQNNLISLIDISCSPAPQIPANIHPFMVKSSDTDSCSSDIRLYFRFKVFTNLAILLANGAATSENQMFILSYCHPKNFVSTKPLS